ncbi:transglutaminaseTgpA domain-containing protein, partial [Magnetococcales bacterium HHB-1]
MHDFLSRSSLLWLLAALVAGLLLHAGHLPIWILIAAFVTISWRLLMHAGRVSAPYKVLKLVLVAASFGGVYLSYGKDFSLESMVALFSIGAVLKPIEVSTHRDTYVLIFLCYFLSAVEFLFDQNPETALAVVAALLLTMSAQISLNLQSATGKTSQISENQPLKLASKILVQSIPLAIILFIFVPRVAPLWSLNVKTHAAKTGLAESMTPGDIAKLGASDELAFIATFEDDVPANEALYWRALTMDKFDGKTWKPSLPFGETQWVTPSRLLGDQLTKNLDKRVSYSVLVEPHDQKWLFALDRAYPQTSNTGLTNDFRVESRYRISNKMLYHIQSDLDAPLFNEPLSRVERYQYTHLPNGDNQQTRALAARLQMGVSSDLDYIQAVSQFYLNNPFIYTLKPELLGDDDTIDGFLFGTKSGFCAHYAGSFTYLMRLAGIPARIVTGYQGGEFNDAGGYLA